ncbi:SDR family oxidoreductase [Octadecabacter sp. CECT 8868]|uniref:SDR family oxidoreductase n=1 Tax=Octadecabacter algicola TaxID=2909342 RepID=UPI001F161878|nr:SDR family oxidoreductase [Octadecabacter algicola]MCF2903823.1 SDR family oxidoreductase [Octadecabacter algicola]
MSRIALVTGGGSGIGRACAEALAQAGFHVIVTGRKLDTLRETVMRMGSGSSIVCDLTDADQVETLFEQVKSDHGRLDLLFNNAGNNVPAAPIGDIPPEDFLTVMNVNVYGAFLAARGAFNLMRAQSPQGGRIINNGSISAAVPRPGSTPYTASKHAMTGMTRTISLDGRPFNIACGQIDIGNAASDMTTQMQSGVPQADLSIKPEPVMDVDHVASTVVHMAQLPLSANVQFVTVMASAMPFIGRG